MKLLSNSNAQISHAHPQILHLGETIYLFQPPEEPGGSWEELEAVTWAIEQIPDGQVKVLLSICLGIHSPQAGSG